MIYAIKLNCNEINIFSVQQDRFAALHPRERESESRPEYRHRAIAQNKLKRNENYAMALRLTTIYHYHSLPNGERQMFFN